VAFGPVVDDATLDHIDVVGATSEADQRALARDASFRAPWNRWTLPLALAMLVGLLAFVQRDRGLVAAISGPLALLVVVGIGLVASQAMTRRQHPFRPSRGSIVPGGVEVHFEASQFWFPTSEIAAWAIAGRSLVFRFNGFVAVFDARSLGAGAVEHIAALLARDPAPRVSGATPTAAWASTVAVERTKARNARRAGSGLAPQIALWVAVIFGASFALGFLPTVIEWFADEASVDPVRFATAATTALVGAVVITAVLAVLVVLSTRSAVAKRARGQVYRVHLFDQAFVASSSLGDAALVPYPGVERVELHGDDLVLVTVDPLIIDIPLSAFLPGGFEHLTGAIAAAGGPAPPAPAAGRRS
jgi:hypothetical protein